MNVKYVITQPELARIAGVRNQAIAQQAQKLGLTSTQIGNRTAYGPSSVRALLEQRGFKYPKQVISFQMLKGGSTKTSCGFHLAVRLNQYGAKVLVVDADGQANMSSSFGCPPNGEEIVLFHVIKGEAQIEDAIVRITDGLDLIASSFDNSVIDTVVFQTRQNIKRMISDLIAPIRNNYDFIIFDCNPSLSALNIAIALASDLVILPVNPDDYSKQGLEKTLDEFSRMSTQYEKNIEFRLLYTLHDAREATSRKYLIEYGSKYEDRMFNSIIRRNADVKTAIDQKCTVFDLKKAAARPDFDAFALEILQFPENLKGAGNA